MTPLEAALLVVFGPGLFVAAFYVCRALYRDLRRDCDK